MSVQTQARALMMRHHLAAQHRQQCVMTRAAAEIGLPSEAVDRWIHNQGKSRLISGVSGQNHAAMS